MTKSYKIFDMPTTSWDVEDQFVFIHEITNTDEQ